MKWLILFANSVAAHGNKSCCLTRSILLIKAHEWQEHKSLSPQSALEVFPHAKEEGEEKQNDWSNSVGGDVPRNQALGQLWINGKKR